MKPWQRFFRSFEVLENLLPRGSRLPLRYQAQKLLAALEPEMALLPDLCSRERAAVDIGANKGIYSYALAQLSSHVYSFEPLRECCDYISHYGHERISVHNVALSDVDDSLKIYIPVDGWRTVYTRASLVPVAGKHELRHVPVRRLDDFDLRGIGFIKIDVEGHELFVLRGARGHLMRDTPDLLVEIDLHSHVEFGYLEVFNYLYELGYESYILLDKVLIKARGRELELGKTSINFVFQFEARPDEGNL